MRRLNTASLVALVLLAAGSGIAQEPAEQLAPAPAERTAEPPAAEATQQGAADAAAARIARRCNLCHADKFQSAARNPHRVLDDADWQARTGEALSCRNCHGDVDEHLRQAGRAPVFAFRDEPLTERNGRCLGCHAASHPAFDRSPHAQAGLACTSCHTQHGEHAATALLRLAAPEIRALGDTSGVCFGCHGEQFAEAEYNEHHRLREGVLECTSCHDPHAAATRTLLGGFKQERCVGCHSDKGGPFVFEHPASRVEGCTTCHSPHGSPNRHMLAHQRVAELCFSCHAAVPAFHGGNNLAQPPRFGLDTQCTNCHSAIHGSHFDPFFLR
jgi:DmsE family decaheme c-type cytochrome